MLKKISILLVLFFLSLFWFVNNSYAEWVELSEDNILMKAFEQRKKKLFEVINCRELSQEISKLKIEINSIESWEELNLEIKNKFLSEIEKIEKSINENKDKLNKEELEKFLKESQDAIELKNNLIQKLNSEIEDNKINKEKNESLLKKYSKLQEEENKKNTNENNKK